MKEDDDLRKRLLEYKNRGIERFNDDSDWNDTLTNIEDVVLVLLWGREFEFEYDSLIGFATNCGEKKLNVSTEKGREEIGYYSTDDPDEFCEKATFGPYLVKDIVGKWTITWHA